MKKMMKTACLIAPLLGLAGPANALPEGEYACKVQTRTAKLGVVFVQAYDREAAKTVASEASAMLRDGTRERAQMTLECIRFPGERFADSEFNDFVRSIPL